MRDTDPPEPAPDDPASTDGDIMAGDRRIARCDTALPDWYVSDTHYRPIPIVWFAGALVMQVIAQPAAAILLYAVFGLPALVAVGACLLVSGMIWHITNERGMAHAPRAWQIATALMLGFFFAITAAGLLG